MTAKAKQATRLTSRDLVARLRKRYAPPEYAFFTEVGDATGGRSGSIDGLAMSLWPSRGLEMIGFEIKVDRRDWLRELKNPAKAEKFARYADRWWLVVGDAKIVATGELPPTWGLMVARGTGLAIVREAPKTEPGLLDRPLLAAILRAVHTQSANEVQLRMARAEGLHEGRVQGLDEAKADQERAVSDSLRLRESVAAFEKAAGVKIDHWNGQRIGDAVATVLSLNHLDHRATIERVVEQLGRTKADLLAALKATPREREMCTRCGERSGTERPCIRPGVHTFPPTEAPL